MLRRNRRPPELHDPAVGALVVASVACSVVAAAAAVLAWWTSPDTPTGQEFRSIAAAVERYGGK